MDGFERFAQGHLITLFSATNYCGQSSLVFCYQLLRLVLTEFFIFPMRETRDGAAVSRLPFTWQCYEERFLRRVDQFVDFHELFVLPSRVMCMYHSPICTSTPDTIQDFGSIRLCLPRLLNSLFAVSNSLVPSLQELQVMLGQSQFWDVISLWFRNSSIPYLRLSLLPMDHLIRRKIHGCRFSLLYYFC